MSTSGDEIRQFFSKNVLFPTRSENEMAQKWQCLANDKETQMCYTVIVQKCRETRHRFQKTGVSFLFSSRMRVWRKKRRFFDGKYLWSEIARMTSDAQEKRGILTNESCEL